MRQIEVRLHDGTRVLVDLYDDANWQVEVSVKHPSDNLWSPVGDIQMRQWSPDGYQLPWLEPTPTKEEPDAQDQSG